MRLRSINRPACRRDTYKANRTGYRMRHLFEPRLVNDSFGDPGLYVDFRDERRALLFDLGDIAVLPPRKLLRVSHVFVSHTHMDHLIGFDRLSRVSVGRANAVQPGSTPS